MDLPAAGREYAHATVTALPDDVDLETSIDGTTWIPVERGTWVPATHTWTAGTGPDIRVLVAGPDAPNDDPAETLRLAAAGRSVLTLRAVDHPEVVIRPWGAINVR